MDKQKKLFIFLGLAIMGLVIFGVITSKNSVGAPATFIGPVATTSRSADVGFTIGTTTPLTRYGTTTLAIYGSTTIQTPVNTNFAFWILNAASSSIFQVDTANASSTFFGTVNMGALTVTSCTGCGGGGGGGSFGQAWELLSTDSTILAPTTTPIGIRINNATSTITNLTMVLSTSTQATTTWLNTTNLRINSENFTDLTGAGLTLSTGALTVGTGAITNAMLSTSPTSEFNYAVGVGEQSWLYLTPTSTAVGLLTTSSSTISNLSITLSTTTRATTTYLNAGTFIYSNGGLAFDGEIQPDGAVCADGEILKKTGADNWDCAADATGGAGGSGVAAPLYLTANTTARVGIGTSTPGALFSVAATTTAAGPNNQILYGIGEFIYASSSTSTIPQSGYAYTISTSSTVRPFFSLNGTSSQILLNRGSSSAPVVSFLGDEHTGVFSGGAGNLAITTESVSRFNIDSVDAVFTVPGRFPNGSVSAPGIAFSANTDTGWWSTSSNGASFTQDGNDVLNFDPTSQEIVINEDNFTSLDVFRIEGQTGGSNIFQLDLLGSGSLNLGNTDFLYDVGISSSTPFAGLSVEQVTSNTPVVFVGDQGTSTPHLIVDGSGRVGIGTSSLVSTGNLTYKFGVNGTVALQGISAGAAGDDDVCMNPLTNELTDANSSTCIVSSVRFKENILPQENAMSTIMALNPVSFNYKPELDHSIIKGKKHFGLIAEEVEKIIPEIVRYEDDGVTPRSLAYDELIPFLIKGMQEQQLEINELKKEIEYLKSK